MVFYEVMWFMDHDDLIQDDFEDSQYAWSYGKSSSGGLFNNSMTSLSVFFCN